ARAVSASCSLLTVLIIYATGLRLFDRWTALLGAFFFAIAPVAVFFGPYVKEIGLLMLLANLAVYEMVRYAREGELRHYWIAAFCTGLAASTQQTGFLYIAGVIAGGWIFNVWYRRGHPIEAWIAGILLAGAGVFLGNPGLILETGKTLSRLSWLLAL